MLAGAGWGWLRLLQLWPVVAMAHMIPEPGCATHNLVQTLELPGSQLGTLLLPALRVCPARPLPGLSGAESMDSGPVGSRGPSSPPL